MTLLHQAAQKAVEALKLGARHAQANARNAHFEGGRKEYWADGEKIDAAAKALESALQHQEVPREPVADFDTWQQNPYTKVLMDSIKNDYMPRADAEALIRAAASPTTTRQQEVGSDALTLLRDLVTLSSGPGFHEAWKRAQELVAAAPSTPEKLDASS